MICRTEGHLAFFSFHSPKWHGHPTRFYRMRNYRPRDSKEILHLYSYVGPRVTLLSFPSIHLSDMGIPLVWFLMRYWTCMHMSNRRVRTLRQQKTLNRNKLAKCLPRWVSPTALITASDGACIPIAMGFDLVCTSLRSGRWSDSRRQWNVK